MTPRMRKFCEAYLRLFNGRQAAIEAGYSESSAAQRASELIRHPEVAAEIASRRLSKEMGAECTYRNMRKLTDFALQGLRDMGDNVTVQERCQLTESARKCLDTLARIEGLHVDRLDVSGKVDVTHNLADLARRAREYRANLDRAESEPILLEHNPPQVIETPAADLTPIPTRQEQEPGQST